MSVLLDQDKVEQDVTPRLPRLKGLRQQYQKCGRTKKEDDYQTQARPTHPPPLDDFPHLIAGAQGRVRLIQ
jgi:hypothetical protein